MSTNILREAARIISQPAFTLKDRKMNEASLKSLREYRRQRFANRQMPVQPKAAA